MAAGRILNRNARHVQLLGHNFQSPGDVRHDLLPVLIAPTLSLRQIESFIREQDLIPRGSTVLCAVSGGADSVAMLHVLYRLRDRMDFTLAAAHYNHRLRGAESDRDQRFVEQFVQLCCGAHRRPDGTCLPPVPLYTGSGDVAAPPGGG